MTTLTDAETEIVRLALRFPDSPGLVALAQGVMDGAANTERPTWEALLTRAHEPERPTVSPMVTCTCGLLPDLPLGQIPGPFVIDDGVYHHHVGKYMCHSRAVTCPWNEKLP